MPESNALPRTLRIAAAAALAVWLAVALWMVVHLQTIGSTHPRARVNDLGGLLLPCILLAGSALVLVLVPRRAAIGWAAVLVFSFAGVPAWLFLRGSSYRAIPWVDRSFVDAAIWMTLGLIAGLIVLGLLALRGTREPATDHELMRDSIQSLARRDTPESLVRQRFDDRNVPPGV
jgi:hypothetical protein